MQLTCLLIAAMAGIALFLPGRAQALLANNATTVNGPVPVLPEYARSPCDCTYRVKKGPWGIFWKRGEYRIKVVEEARFNHGDCGWRFRQSLKAECRGHKQHKFKCGRSGPRGHDAEMTFQLNYDKCDRSTVVKAMVKSTEGFCDVSDCRMVQENGDSG